jgi:hypothetical protein
MAFEQRDMSGSLFKNDKRQNDKQPEYKGDCLIDGVAYWISAWVKDSKNGKFFSFAFKPKEQGGGQQRKNSSPNYSGGDDVPF